MGMLIEPRIKWILKEFAFNDAILILLSTFAIALVVETVCLVWGLVDKLYEYVVVGLLLIMLDLLLILCGCILSKLLEPCCDADRTINN